jgi:hypothetical protein
MARELREVLPARTPDGYLYSIAALRAALTAMYRGV